MEKSRKKFRGAPEGVARCCFEGRTQQQQRKSFRDYTESPIREGGEGDQLLERIRYGVLLGS